MNLKEFRTWRDTALGASSSWKHPRTQQGFLHPASTPFVLMHSCGTFYEIRWVWHIGYIP